MEILLLILVMIRLGWTMYLYALQNTDPLKRDYYDYTCVHYVITLNLLIAYIGIYIGDLYVFPLALFWCWLDWKAYKNIDNE